jgi:hypothetical protein
MARKLKIRTWPASPPEFQPNLRLLIFAKYLPGTAKDESMIRKPAGVEFEKRASGSGTLAQQNVVRHFVY